MQSSLPPQYLQSGFQDAIPEVKGCDNPESLAIAVFTPDWRPLAEELVMNQEPGTTANVAVISMASSSPQSFLAWPSSFRQCFITLS